ncbi:RNA polymerase II transcription factor B subunit 2 [Suhomyces tanzawaensis NRRL Y-17324]|uniref:RNA polymerase II transcription factor B subunit 2 n=1 Tax=Suhomyces tanzawaensis NRRL Y-17324 TaxID=984487 RepID=A0A1E4SKQ1_9ASCO|nr:RNA polymerase II transcription factor B subunit 2 [Suhomyces tanzawaensis NRRL Y-17324]ODV80086.1 RNA polymerase II transcription factor B subunit 2 [Suhomyces tanzawaensis NRRL Y-17324]
MSSSNLFRATVNEYLEGLPQPVQSKLYEAPATCLSIFRLLPPMTKFYIMTMLFNEKPVALRDMDKWCKPGSRKLQFESLKRLKALHLIKEDNTGTHIRLNSTFRQNFRDCLTGSQAANAFGNLCTTPDKHKVDAAFLDTFASQKWETILHFMVGTESTVTPSTSVLSLLKLGGLMEGPGTNPNNLKITNSGFQFLLQDVNAQIWTLLLQYLNLTQDLHMDPVDVLNFIFILGSLELGKSYTVSSLSATQVSMLADLKDYGLVYQRNGNSSRFYPTRLATTLTSDSAALKSPSVALDQALEGAENQAVNTSATPSSQQGTIIIETNFKMYAYTNSPLEIAVLNLFVHLKTRFANMVCGQITRESIRNALYNGITADQIIKFLETHAHPQMRLLAKEKLDKKIEFDASHNINTAGGAPQSQAARDGAVAQHKLELLPPTVVDQIKLWQLELDRIQTFDGYLFKDFSNQQEYDVLSSYASEVGVLIWSDKVRRKFFVTQQGVSQVVDFANRKLQRTR